MQPPEIPSQPEPAPVGTPGQRLDACLAPQLAEQQKLVSQLAEQQAQLNELNQAIASTRQSLETVELEMAGRVRIAAQSDPGLRRILGMSETSVSAETTTTPSKAETAAPTAHAPKEPEPETLTFEAEIEDHPQHPECNRAAARVVRPDTLDHNKALDLETELDLEDAFGTPEDILGESEDPSEKAKTPSPEAEALAAALTDAMVDEQIEQAENEAEAKADDEPTQAASEQGPANAKAA